MQEADAFFSSKIDADPNDADALLGRARLILAFGHIAINPGGLGAEPPRRPTVVCSFNH